ncbi:MAG TPA: hypothetical protein VNS53_02150 [Sphingomicrobium sp.]|nr:hypothetical protein [Sphingomicrobium sp.]
MAEQRQCPASAFAAGGASEAAGQDQLPDFDALIAAEQAIQLDELIKWIRSRVEVKPGN